MSHGASFDVTIAADLATELSAINAAINQVIQTYEREPRFTERTAHVTEKLQFAKDSFWVGRTRLCSVMDQLAKLTPEIDGHITWDGAVMWSGQAPDPGLYEQLVDPATAPVSPAPPSSPAPSPAAAPASVAPPAPTPPAGLFGAGGPSILDVNQVTNGYGLCGMVAGVGALVNSNPELLRQIVVDNGNGTFTINLPNKGPITVSHAEVFGSAGTSPYGESSTGNTWFPVLAHVLVNYVFPSTPVSEDQYGNPAAWSLGRPVNPAAVLQILTGGGQTFWPGQVPSSSQQVVNAVNAGQPVVIWFSGPGGAENLIPGTSALSLHAYTVTSINGDGTMTLYNPWGTDLLSGSVDGNNDGFIQVPVSLIDTHNGGVTVG